MAGRGYGAGAALDSRPSIDNNGGNDILHVRVAPRLARVLKVPQCKKVTESVVSESADDSGVAETRSRSQNVSLITQVRTQP